MRQKILGNPCKYGHHDENGQNFRYLMKNGKCGACVECVKIWQQANIDKMKAQHKAWRAANFEKVKEQAKARYAANVEKVKSQQKVYRAANRMKINVYQKNKRKTDTNFKLGWYLRTRLNSAIKNNQKIGSAVRDLGCSIEQLKQHFESQFEPWMTWDNWGNKAGCWSIDHIKPLSKFDLTDRQQLLEACHYTNLRPIRHIDNLKKANLLMI